MRFTADGNAGRKRVFDLFSFVKKQGLQITRLKAVGFGISEICDGARKVIGVAPLKRGFYYDLAQTSDGEKNAVFMRIFEVSM